MQHVRFLGDRQFAGRDGEGHVGDFTIGNWGLLWRGRYFDSFGSMGTEVLSYKLDTDFIHKNSKCGE